MTVLVVVVGPDGSTWADEVGGATLGVGVGVAEGDEAGVIGGEAEGTWLGGNELGCGV